MHKILAINIILAFILTIFINPAHASTGVNAGDTAWMLVATALVMLMIPGLGMFYSGMVKKSNAVATIMHSFMKLCVITIIWVICGYSLTFSDSNLWGFIGNFNMFAYSGVGVEAASVASNIPHILFATFQGLFAVITVAIITGSFAERVRLGPILVFSIIWTLAVYVPVAHWVWGGGWIHSQLGALDFAGGAVVHINSGVAGLIAALCLGPRVKSSDKTPVPHNIPLAILGASLLWFGWFGFNAGSALVADGLAALALANTNIAAAAGGLGWFLFEYLRERKTTSIGIISGSISGLVAITPAAGFVEPISAITIGLIGGFICYWAVAILKPKLGYDDSLDAFGIHGIGGIWGAIATGIFATTAVNAGGADGLIHGNFDLVIAQTLSVIAVIIYSAIATYLILWVVRKFVHVRVSIKEEAQGLDETQHGEEGYNLK